MESFWLFIPHFFWLFTFLEQGASWHDGREALNQSTKPLDRITGFNKM
jgi:hypothetical protein